MKPLMSLVWISPISGKVLQVSEGPRMALGGPLHLSDASLFPSESRNSNGSTHLTGLIRQTPLRKDSNHFTPASTKCPSSAEFLPHSGSVGPGGGGSEPIFQVR